MIAISDVFCSIRYMYWTELNHTFPIKFIHAIIWNVLVLISTPWLYMFFVRMRLEIALTPIPSKGFFYFILLTVCAVFVSVLLNSVSTLYVQEVLTIFEKYVYYGNWTRFLWHTGWPRSYRKSVLKFVYRYWEGCVICGIYLR